ncbi:MAG: hypothetical protein M3R01_01335, partial [Actinomycetota bacterium]|nr:hypothetical protein [Actinomycetota bacterium]
PGSPASAQAQGEGTAATTGGGVQVVVTRLDDGTSLTVTTASPGSGRAPSARGNGAADACDYHLIPWYSGTEARVFWVLCNGSFVGLTSIGPDDPAAARAARAVDGRAIAERVVRNVAVGDVEVGARPRTRGVTGVPTLVWVEGYDGTPVERRVNELGVVVDVAVTLAGVRWDFGDGAGAEGTEGKDLGQAWPARSSVRHAYAASSPEGGYPLSVEVTLEAAYRVDGGPWQALSPLRRRAGTSHAVAEVEAVRNR